MPAVDLQNVTASYPGATGPALSGVTLAADRELVALLGPNGSGKSTLMRVLIGLHRLDSGRVIAPSDRRSLGVVFQSPAVDDLLTVRENLRLAAAMTGLPRREASVRVESLADRIGLRRTLDTRCGRLSGGERRRADLARALMGRPTLLVLDEPTTGLDIDARARFWSTLDAVRADEGVTVLVATHSGEEAARADRAVLLRDGRVVADAAPDELRRPLGRRVGRVDLRAGGDAASVRDWLGHAAPDARWWSGGALAPDAAPDLIESCPRDAASVRIGAPTLEDAYLWHTAATGGSA